MNDHMHCADLGDGTYKNPIIFGGFGDCTILKDGKDYFMTYGGGGARGSLMLHSQDLVNWEPLYHALKNQEPRFWAPEMVKVGDTYYIYNFIPTTNPHWNYGDLVVMTTKDIWHGPWSEPKVMAKNIPVIDPGHVVGEDGKRYLYMSTNLMYKLTDDGLDIASDLIRAYPDWPIPDDWDVEGLCTESPKFTWHDGWLYLLLAEGGTAGPPTSHCVVAMRSRSAQGPWEMSPYNPIKHTFSKDETWWSKGHGTLVEGPDGQQWYMMYQGFLNNHRNTTGKATLMEPIEWTDDGWFRVCPESRDDEAIPMPKGGVKIENKLRLSDDFAKRELGLQWYPANITMEDERLSFVDGGLQMISEGGCAEDSAPLLCRREHVSLEVTAELTADWYAGGGICFSGGGKICGIAIEQGTIKVFNDGMQWMRNRENIVDCETKNWDGTHLYLKLLNGEDIISPWYSYDGKDWKKINMCFDTTTWRRNVMPGLFCYGAGKTVFHKFIYNGLD